MERISLASVAAAFVTFAALSAHAATVTVTAVGTPSPGSNITLQVHVSVSPADGLDQSLFGALVYPSTTLIAPPTPGTQNAFIPVAPGLPFGTGSLTCTSIRCLVFNQISGVQGPQSGNVTDFLIAQQTYTILPGVLDGAVLTWSWQTSPTTQRLDFFGAVAPVPALSITVIPEPATAALLGLGLLGLAAARRRA